MGRKSDQKGVCKGPAASRSRAASPDREAGAIAAFVRERRRANRLTQRALAELAGVGPRAIWDLERGKPTARMDVVNAVLRVFGKALGVVDAPRRSGGNA